MRFLPVFLVLVFVAGCTQPNLDEPAPTEASLFGPNTMRIHPIFTQIKDWTDDGTPDGFEALIEFQDQFGDPTKASGTIMFELYDYRKADPEPRGRRIENPWIAAVTTRNEQIARWNRTSRTYTFQLAYPAINRKRGYVLQATFRSSTGGRFFDRVVFEAQEETPTTQPTTQPSTQPAKSPFGF